MEKIIINRHRVENCAWKYICHRFGVVEFDGDILVYPDSIDLTAFEVTAIGYRHDEKLTITANSYKD